MLLNEVLIILITSAASLIVSTVNMIIANKNRQRAQLIEEENKRRAQLVEEKAKEDCEIREAISKNTEAAQVILHHALRQECQCAVTNGHISYDDFANINYMYKAYKALGGNGVIEHLYKQIKELPNREE